MKEIIITLLGSVALAVISFVTLLFVIGFFIAVNPFAWIALALVAIFK